jgi:AcrR family transcriptional regulator
MGRNKKNNELMKDERKNQIFVSALKLFASRGLAGTKISDIAQDAGFSQGLVYHYFKSKDDIYTALINRAFTNLNKALDYLENMDKPPLEKIRFAFDELINNFIKSDITAKNHLLIAISAASDSVPAAVKQIIGENYQLPYTVIRKIIEAGQQDGTIANHNSEELSMLFWSTINGLAIFRSVHDENFIKPDPNIFLQMFKK